MTVFCLLYLLCPPPLPTPATCSSSWNPPSATGREGIRMWTCRGDKSSPWGWFKVMGGEQNLPPQNVSLACGLFRAENNQGSKDSGSLSFHHPLSCLENLGRGPVSGTELSAETYAKNMCWMWGGNSQRSESTLCPTVSVWPGKRLFTKHLLFHLYVNCLPAPLKSQTPTPNILFCL